MLGQVSVGELRMPPQLFTSLVTSSTPGDMVGGGFFKSESPSFAFSAADKALRSGSSSPAPRTRERAPWSYQGRAWGLPCVAANLALRLRAQVRMERVHTGSFVGVGSLDIQSGSHSEWPDADAEHSP